MTGRPFADATPDDILVALAILRRRQETTAAAAVEAASDLRFKSEDVTGVAGGLRDHYQKLKEQGASLFARASARLRETLCIDGRPRPLPSGLTTMMALTLRNLSDDDPELSEEELASLLGEFLLKIGLARFCREAADLTDASSR